jgi:arylsulfatase A-like enzyme
MKKHLLFFFFFISAHLFAQKPNIVLILADDLRADALGCYGNSYIKTPNIDKLAAEGLLFNRSYILGGDQGAICSPSRAMLMSSKSFFKISNKIAEENTLPLLLKQHSYHTMMTGKWHNEPKAIARGFSEAQNVFLGGMDDHFKTKMHTQDIDGSMKPIETPGYSTDIFTETALSFIQNTQNKKKPFFLYLPFTTPHDPRSPSPAFSGMYREAQMPLPPNFLSLHPFSFGYEMGGRDEFLASHPRTPETIKAQWADYAAMISHLDQSVGKIISSLKKQNLYQNTIIIFSSDNGLAMGSHGLMGKQNLYEHSMKIPMIIAGPGVAKNQKTEAMVYLMDLMPTLLQKLNLPLPTDIDGKSFSAVLSQPRLGSREQILTGYLKHQRSLRTERYKLIRYPYIDHTLLFDLKTDPYELHDLADDPAFDAIKTDLLKRLELLQGIMGDKAPLRASEILPKAWDYKLLKRVPDQWQPPYIIDKYFDKNTSPKVY